MESLFYSDVFVRIPLYAMIGLVTEVLFTGTADLVKPSYLASWRLKNAPPQVKRDSRTMAYTFLWMIPLWAMFVFLEPLHQAFGGIHWMFRGIVYTAVFFVGEYTMGALLKKITGSCPWDYSNSRYSIHGYIRLDFFPFWFVYALFMENIMLKLIQLTPAIKSIL